MANVPAYYIIPLNSQPQVFDITLAGVDYVMTVKWNDMGQSWIMDIADVNGVPIVGCIPLITGADLLVGLAYLGIGGQLFILTSQGKYPDEVPGLDDLGVNSNIYFYTSNPNE